MRESATVLVGMSIADVNRREELMSYAESRDWSIAFLQMGDPSLSAELTRLADLGTSRVTLIGVDYGPIAPAASWLRRIAAYWWREHTGHKPALEAATRLARNVAEIEEVSEDLREIHGGEPGLTSAAWDSPTAHRHQVMICRGPRCTAKGATESLRSILIAMMNSGLTDDDVLLVHTGCQFPCNQAPVISVQPDDVWYGNIDPAAAARIATEHLAAGRAVDAYRLERS